MANSRTESLTRRETNGSTEDEKLLWRASMVARKSIHA